MYVLEYSYEKFTSPISNQRDSSLFLLKMLKDSMYKDHKRVIQME